MINIKNIAIILLLSISLISCSNNNNNTSNNDIAVKKEFDNKLVYEIDDSIPIESYKNSCKKSWWTFNKCWSSCWPDAEMCIQVCAYTCEFENSKEINIWKENQSKSNIKKEFSDDESWINWKVIVDKNNKEITISWKAKWYWYFEWQFNLQLVNNDWTMISQKPVIANWEWMTEDYVTFNDITMNYEELNTNNIQVVFNKANPSWLPENEFSKTININLK